jgi:hypothetical protein
MTTLEAPITAEPNVASRAEANVQGMQGAAATTEHKHVGNVAVTVSYSTPDCLRVSDQELEHYIQRGRNLERSKDLAWIDLAVDGEDVGIHYGYHAQPFERIRRITGYLVGTLDRFNDAKRAEEHDRVKHDISCACH